MHIKKLFLVVAAAAVLLFWGTVSIAQEIESSPQILPSPSPQAESVEYFLPYPGILPDHPLYIFKQIRDRILGIAITDPVKRVEFNLLMADKRLNMGIMLTERGKGKLAQSTVAAAEEYLLEATDGLVVLVGRQEQNGSAPLRDRLRRATSKHLEVVDQLTQTADEAHRAEYAAARATAEQARDTVHNL